MRRICCLIALCVFAQNAVAFGPPDSARNCAPVAVNLNAPVTDEYNILRIDTELRLLAFNGAKQPKLAHQIARSLAIDIQGLPNRRLGSTLDDRLAPIYIKLDGPEAEAWLATIPSKSSEHTYYDYKALAYNAAILAVHDSPKFQIELVELGLSNGAFQISSMPQILIRLKREAPGDAVLLFHQVIEAFPRIWVTDQDVRFLLHLTELMQDTSGGDATKAVKLMVAALDNPDLQSPPQLKTVSFPTSQSAKDPNATLRSQVERMAASLQIDVSQSNTSASIQQLPASPITRNGNFGEAFLSAAGSMPAPSAALQTAIENLHSDSSENDVMQLANSISDKNEQARFYALVVRRLENRPASIAHLAAPILNAIRGTSDPAFSLGIPRILLQFSLQVNELAKAQLALAAFSQNASGTCSDSHLRDGDAGYENGSVCIREYAMMAVELATTPNGGGLQVTDPSLVERLTMDRSQHCDAPVPSAAVAAK